MTDVSKKKIIDVIVGEPKSHKNYGYESVYISGYPSIYFDGSKIDSVIEELSKLKESYSKMYHDLRLTKINDCGCPCECSCSPTITLKGKRHETDLEFNIRVKKEEKLEEEKNKRELAEFERLKIKFEKS